MEDTQVIIAYRSRGDQAIDEFWYDVAGPWIYDNFHWILITTIVLILALKVFDRIIHRPRSYNIGNRNRSRFFQK